jgi:diguanylate cyclase (GGDEF)-like protein
METPHPAQPLAPQRAAELRMQGWMNLWLASKAALKSMLMCLGGFMPGRTPSRAELLAENTKLRQRYQLALQECNAIAQPWPKENILHSHVAARVRLRCVELAEKIAELERLAHTDCLTSLMNRRAFTQAAHAELARMRRNAKPACVLLLDIDHFKAFNDCCGHDAGDQVLKKMAAILRETTRAADVVARWGGEEFMILLPETDVAGAEKVAEKCRTAVQNCPLVCRDHTIGVNITVGVSAISAPDGIEAAIARADAALYQGKNSGRNQVVVAG